MANRWYRERHSTVTGWRTGERRFVQVEGTYEFTFKGNRKLTSTGTSMRFPPDGSPNMVIENYHIAQLHEDAKIKALMNASTKSDASADVIRVKTIEEHVIVYRLLKDKGKYKRTGIPKSPPRLKEPVYKPKQTAWVTARNGKQYIALKDEKGNNYRWMDRQGKKYSNRQFVSHIQKGEEGKPLKG